jgi:tetratricopeptide (TPR) repeat protein
MELSHGLAQLNNAVKNSQTVVYPRNFITDTWFFTEQDTTKSLQVTRLLYLINYFYSIREYDQTLTIIQQALDLNHTKKKELLEIKARVFKRLGRFREALEILDQLKTDASILFLKGQLHLKAGNYCSGLESFVDYLNIRPDDYSAWLEMSRITRLIQKESDLVHGISAHDWNLIGDIMVWISDIYYNRPTSSSGELLSRRKRKSKLSFNSINVEDTISLLQNEFGNLEKLMRTSCLQLGIIEVR